jgi:maleylpyruvate isomerase
LWEAVPVPENLEAEPEPTISMCRAAHARLLATTRPIDDDQVRSPSRLPGWTVAYVLTHLARNADGHTRRLEAALRGEDLPRYPGGPAQRDSDIADGARRPVEAIVSDLRDAQVRLEQVWDLSVAADWPHRDLLGDDQWPTTASPVRRLREVEVHHVDLGLGYEPSDWPAEYVAWELPMILATVPNRARRPNDARDLVAWLSGRGPVPTETELSPW